jgi:hypothetical protein
MRRALTAAFLVGAFALPAIAGELGIGDDVPGVDIEKFFQGMSITGFDKDRTYVLEFWATW